MVCREIPAAETGFWGILKQHKTIYNMDNKIYRNEDCESSLDNEVVLGENYMQLMKRNPHLSHLHFMTQFANTNIKKSNNET